MKNATEMEARELSATQVNAMTWEDLNPDWIEEGCLTQHFAKSQFADCPGCGKFEQLEVLNVGADDPGIIVLCRPCQFMAQGETPSEAIEHWNTRATPAPSAELAEAGRALVPLVDEYLKEFFGILYDAEKTEQANNALKAAIDAIPKQEPPVGICAGQAGEKPLKSRICMCRHDLGRHYQGGACHSKMENGYLCLCRKFDPAQPQAAEESEGPCCASCGKNFATTGTACDKCNAPMHTQCYHRGGGRCPACPQPPVPHFDGPMVYPPDENQE